MSINIIDGFYLGSSTPIDTRFVVANSSERTSIVHKYDGLKVFQRDTRQTWVWNAPSNIWELDNSGFLNGTGTLNYLAKWTSSSVVGTSSMFSSTDNKFGIGDMNPLSNFQIRDNGGSPLSINVRYVSATNDSAVVGYNWYYNSGDLYFDVTKKSSFVEMNSTNGFIFKTRNQGSTNWTSNLTLNSSTSGWNILRSSGSGNYIVGTLSVSNLSSPVTPNQLITFDGSFRTLKSIYKSTIIRSLSSNYTVTSDDHQLIIQTTGTRVITLPSLTSNEVGRELVISVESGIINLTSTQNILDIDGSVFSGIVNPGITIKLVMLELIPTVSFRWKVIGYENSLVGGGNDGDFLIRTSGTWQRRNFLSHLASSTFLGTTTGTYLRLNTSNKELSLSGNGQSKLIVQHSTYGLIHNLATSGGETSLYIISGNSSNPTVGSEKIIIQTRQLSIPRTDGGSENDPFTPDGSIQIASKTSINLISKSGEYFFGNRLATGLSSSVLPPIITTSAANIQTMYLDTDSGKVFLGNFAQSQATEIQTGVAEIATLAEVNAGTDDERIITPLKLRNTTEVMGVDGGIKLRKKVLNIGSWPITTTSTKSLSHGLGSDFIKIREIDVIVKNDTETQIWQITGGDLQQSVDSSVIYLQKNPGTILPGMTNTLNRGWVTITYEV